MIELGIAQVEPERREASGYTDLIVSALLSRASGGLLDTPQAVGALEVAAGIWQRAFQSAAVREPNARTGSIAPEMLGIIGRQLCRTGQAVFAIEVDGQHVKLLPVWSWDVHGGPDPASWWYRLDIAGPSSQTTIVRGAESVVHLRYAVDPAHPWIGLSPLAVAASTGRLAGLLEQALGDEAGTPRGTLITTPEGTGAAGDGDDPDADPYAAIKGDLLRLKGDVALVESFAAGAGDKGARPDRDWKPERLGANPPAALVELRGAVFDGVLGACGISPALFASSATATGIREAFRTFYRVTLLPIGAAVERELTDKLETPVRLDFRKLGAADVATAARAYRALVGKDAVMSDADARTLTGLE